MPELPEVEITRRGIEPLLVGRRVVAVRVYNARLRWPVPRALARRLPGREIHSVTRRAKYLLVGTDAGTLILHLGMSGSLRLVPEGLPPERHEHLDFALGDRRVLRLRDPRRFGAALWTPRDPLIHPLLRHLGPEPLGPDFDGARLHRMARGRRAAVKTFIMDGRVVAGVGNIYANEALYRAGIHPARAAGRIALPRYERLAGALREVLAEAILQGGTTLRDFVSSDGAPGYFSIRLRVYGKGVGGACERCGTVLASRVIGQRSSVYCPRCQR